MPACNAIPVGAPSGAAVFRIGTTVFDAIRRCPSTTAAAMKPGYPRPTAKGVIDHEALVHPLGHRQRSARPRRRAGPAHLRLRLEPRRFSHDDPGNRLRRDPAVLVERFRRSRSDRRRREAPRTGPRAHDPAALARGKTPTVDSGAGHGSLSGRGGGRGPRRHRGRAVSGARRSERQHHRTHHAQPTGPGWLTDLRAYDPGRGSGEFRRA